MAKVKLIEYEYMEKESDPHRGDREWKEKKQAILIPGSGEETLVVRGGEEVYFVTMFPKRVSSQKNEFVWKPSNVPLPENGYRVLKTIDATSDFIKASRRAASVFCGLGLLKMEVRRILPDSK